MSAFSYVQLMIKIPQLMTCESRINKQKAQLSLVCNWWHVSHVPINKKGISPYITDDRDLTTDDIWPFYLVCNWYVSHVPINKDGISPYITDDRDLRVDDIWPFYLVCNWWYVSHISIYSKERFHECKWWWDLDIDDMKLAYWYIESTVISRLWLVIFSNFLINRQ
jgi:hypothetical protein